LAGAETIDPTNNYTYSKSYIFNFGIPLVETGIMTISHVNPVPS
jgi:Putative beta-barrel porin-2, OmpL-like. bbp2